MTFNNLLPINQILTGPQAFYNQRDYEVTMAKEMASSET